MDRKSTLGRTILIWILLLAGLMLSAPQGTAVINAQSVTAVDSATLYLYADGTELGADVQVHRVTTDWDENTVTWNSFYSVGNPYDPSVEGAFMPVSGWNAVDVTALVQSWANGAPNQGLLLERDAGGATPYHSGEYADDPTLRPKMEICYSGGACTTIQRGLEGDIADALISALSPDTAYGTAPRLVTGIVLGFRKQTLLRFDLPQPPVVDGCTLTPGYWKTHSEYGPAPYDVTWAALPSGADTPFFLSGQSYYQVLWTQPKGNAYYILAHAYIAAELNIINGASVPPEVQTAWDEATALFETYEPADVKGDKVLKRIFVPLAELLDDYNNGFIGPGHCED